MNLPESVVTHFCKPTNNGEALNTGRIYGNTVATNKMEP